MRGLFLAGIACLLLAAACAPATKPRWSPFAPQRAEDWHSGKRLIAGYDANNDGQVTRGELEAGLRQNFWQADHNRDGRLDPEEVAEANQRRIRLDESTAMPLIDWNQDGYVDFDEFAAGVRSQFEQLDLNGDGVISLDEFRRAPQ
jgi:Ca2+-binding EF-hand superfamily protein